ncbi:MAG: hypothetical protein ACFFDW_01475 [Candidatus Thorarchaeota archaeon]
MDKSSSTRKFIENCWKDLNDSNLRKSHSHNDQKSNIKNPNNPAYKDDRDNRSRQLNPKDEVYEKSRSDVDTDE